MRQPNLRAGWYWWLKPYISYLFWHIMWYLHNPDSETKRIPVLMGHCTYCGSNIFVSWVGKEKQKTNKTSRFKFKSQNAPQIFQQLKRRLYKHVKHSNPIQIGDCDITKANTPQQLRIVDVLFYCSYHQWALIASISFLNAPDFRLLNAVCKHRVFSRGGGGDVLVITVIYCTEWRYTCVWACTSPRTHACLIRLPLVSFLLSAFIWIKIRLWPDILLIWVVSFWRISDLDEMSHPVKSDSRQHTNV